VIEVGVEVVLEFEKNKTETPNLSRSTATIYQFIISRVESHPHEHNE